MELKKTDPIIIKYKTQHEKMETGFDITLKAIGYTGYAVDIICRMTTNEITFAEFSKLDVSFPKKFFSNLPKYNGYGDGLEMLWTMRTSGELEGFLINVLEAVWVMIQKLSKVHCEVWKKAVNPDADSDE